MSNHSSPSLVLADEHGAIIDVPFLKAVGAQGLTIAPLKGSDLIALPPGSELFVLPARLPVAYDSEKERVVYVDEHPYSGTAKKCFAVAAFVAPGYTLTATAAYKPCEKEELLPLFAYAAVAFYKGKFYVSAMRVDREKRQDVRFMQYDLVRENIKRYRLLFPRNRLIRHLENCALVNGCPAALNFFQERFEAPLPTSPTCNAQCLGCISHQPLNKCATTQPRISFRPTAEEVAEVALHHIAVVKDPVVSFGQGCEGEPLLEGKRIARAIRLIRSQTKKGIINCNTNASKPEVIQHLLEAGLDSIRVSINSVCEKKYSIYYNPCGYTFDDVLKSISIAKKKKAFVSINYLVMPGINDKHSEYNALRRFIKKFKIDMIQWRNLNYDSLAYARLINDPEEKDGIGMRKMVSSIHQEFHNLMRGYFNPSRLRIERFRKKKISIK